MRTIQRLEEEKSFIQEKVSSLMSDITEINKDLKLSRSTARKIAEILMYEQDSFGDGKMLQLWKKLPVVTKEESYLDAPQERYEFIPNFKDRTEISGGDPDKKTTAEIIVPDVCRKLHKIGIIVTYVGSDVIWFEKVTK